MVNQFLVSPQTSEIEDGNLDLSSQLDANQSTQSGISTPRPDSGFVDNEVIENNYILDIELLLFSFE